MSYKVRVLYRTTFIGIDLFHCYGFMRQGNLKARAVEKVHTSALKTMKRASVPNGI